MVIGIKAFTVFAGDNAPGAAITPSWGGNRELSIITALLERQTFLEIAEHRAVPLVGKGPALNDQLQGRSRFSR